MEKSTSSLLPKKGFMIHCPYCDHRQRVVLDEGNIVENCESCEKDYVLNAKLQIEWITRKIEGEGEGSI